jgi:hypothetical protein
MTEKKDEKIKDEEDELEWQINQGISDNDSDVEDDYDSLQEKYKQQDAKWKKGSYVVIKDSYMNKEFGYNGLVGEVIEDDLFADHLGYIHVKVLNKGPFKDKTIVIECEDVRQATEKEVMKHMVIDAL